MGLAFRQAEAAVTRDEVPIGAVLVDSTTGQVLAADHNRVEELHDPTAHAEMLVIQAAAARLGAPRLVGCDLYVTLEPCCHQGKTPHCTDAVIRAGIARVVAALADPFPLKHFHGSIRQYSWFPTFAVGPDRMVISLDQVQSDLWMTKLPDGK